MKKISGPEWFWIIILIILIILVIFIRYRIIVGGLPTWLKVLFTM